MKTEPSAALPNCPACRGRVIRVCDDDGNGEIWWCRDCGTCSDGGVYMVPGRPEVFRMDGSVLAATSYP